MMPRVACGERRGWVAGMVLGSALIAAWVGLSSAAVFDTPPVLGDRRVELTWQPDYPDDPVYNGNTVLRVDTTYTHIHGGQRAVRWILSSSDGSMAYSVAEGEDAIRGWRTGDGGATGDLPLTAAGEPAAETPAALSMHGSDQRILGARPNGDLHLWRLDRPGPPETIPEPGGVLSLLFFPGQRDTASLAYVSVGTDDSLRVWGRPGSCSGRAGPSRCSARPPARSMSARTGSCLR